MPLRRKLHLILGGLGGLMLLTGFVAGLTLWELRAPLSASPDALPRTDRLLMRGLWIVGGATAVGLLLVALGGRWILGALRRSLQGLWTTIEHVQAGRLAPPVSSGVEDEFGRLARALRRMTQTLSEHTVSRSYLQAILDSMAELLFVVGDDGRILRANQAALNALGLSHSALRGSPLARYFDADPLSAPPDTPPEPVSPADSAGAPATEPDDGSTVERAVERRLLPPDAAARPVLVSRAALRGAGDEDGTLVCVAQDISVRKEAERRLERSLEEKSVLLREVQHRVKNNLQVILSLLHVQAQAVRDPDARRRFGDSLQRVRAIAAIHEQLYGAGDVSRIAFGTYLTRLTHHLRDAHRSRAVSVRVEADADATLPVTQAIPAGLIVNELVSNALEHAFPAGHAGTVTVRFHLDASTATLIVADDGVGARGSIVGLHAAGEAAGGEATGGETTGSPVSEGRAPNGPSSSPPSSNSPSSRPSSSDHPPSGRPSSGGTTLGLRLVRGLVRQLRGTLDVRVDAGVQAVVTFPVGDADASPSPPESVSS
jgi:two-component sensor histidine kinase/HAMP domain-containing protein